MPSPKFLWRFVCARRPINAKRTDNRTGGGGVFFRLGHSVHPGQNVKDVELRSSRSSKQIEDGIGVQSDAILYNFPRLCHDSHCHSVINRGGERETECYSSGNVSIMNLTVRNHRREFDFETGTGNKVYWEFWNEFEGMTCLPYQPLNTTLIASRQNLSQLCLVILF